MHVGHRPAIVGDSTRGRVGLASVVAVTGTVAAYGGYVSRLKRRKGKSQTYASCARIEAIARRTHNQSGVGSRQVHGTNDEYCSGWENFEITEENYLIVRMLTWRKKGEARTRRVTAAVKR